MEALAIFTLLSVLNILILCLFLEETKIGNAIQDKIIEKIKGENHE